MKSFKYILFVALIAFISSCDKASNSVGSSTSEPASVDNGGSGKGGSLARFTIAQGYLYVVDDLKLHAYSLANPASPKLTSTQILGEDIETIYSYKDKLFIGSQNAMYVYSIADASKPTKLGIASHVRACDPVVANDTIAYVTVRSGTTCGGTQNALYVYDVQHVLNPVERNVVPLESPWGLGMVGKTLYVCNGSNGLSLYDISQPYYPTLKQKYFDDTYYDVIPYNNMLICMVQGGMLLYELKPDGQIVKLAKISG
ncbi:MAG: hypothetical protein KDC07_08325 [Chitinophagaceae bacterium]|nr:hypothetical protein [Chitinophagaceae bacterium]MCB9045145.1 hypothetical protein [Chitinophagales bacterium]